jgi:hypothetical protein
LVGTATNLAEVARFGLDGTTVSWCGELRHDPPIVTSLFFAYEILIDGPQEPLVEWAEICKRLLLKPEAFAFLVRNGSLNAEPG